ncbi:DUF6519 domain-containing protein [Kitasatospora sp. NPDC058170]|uniref:DUF6519 domain-containing protein n=1 Tax=Kitasatospora sp. NPDC058170 TaxID=3346364 RepID=UPI0036DE43B6
MHADVERFSFDQRRHFLRVVQQQGRVTLPADGNEQVAILLHHLQALAEDLIGPYGVPSPASGGALGPGFRIDKPPADGGTGVLRIGRGRYWVHGRACENDTEDLLFTAQPDLPDAGVPKDGVHLAYLDVWERHLSAAEDDTIREVALGGPDTCSRTRLVWRVRLTADTPPGRAMDATDIAANWSAWETFLQPPDRGLLAVRADRGSGPQEPCAADPVAGYLGPENQLYRVQIQRGSADGAPTFSWSRDNGSVVHPAVRIAGTTAVLRDQPRDKRTAPAVGSLVEVVDDHGTLRGTPGLLARVLDIDDEGEEYVVHLSTGPAEPIGADRHPLLRRWDHPDVDGGGAVPRRADDGALVVEAPGGAGWLTLEDGVQIRFRPPSGTGTVYRTGDYWTFPARTLTGDVGWPRGADGLPADVPPHGVDHVYGPLAVVTVEGGRATAVQDLRRGFRPTTV